MAGYSPPSGHMFRVERKRGPCWYVKYRLPDGRQVQKKLGPAWTGRGRPPAGYFTKRLAEDRLRQVLSEASRGTLSGSAPRTGVSFAEAAAEFLRYVEQDRQRKPSTLAGYRAIVRSQLLPAFGDLPLESMTTPMIEQWLASLRRSAATRRLALVLLHGIFRRAVKVWGLAANPAAGAEKPPLTRSGDLEVFSPEEVWALVRAAESEQDGAIYLTAAFTGLRMGELLALRWRDVDFAGSVVRSAAATQSASSRRRSPTRSDRSPWPVASPQRSPGSVSDGTGSVRTTWCSPAPPAATSTGRRCAAATRWR
jgi:integrase